MTIDIKTMLITWLVTAVALFIISKLPIGVEIDSMERSLVSAAVFGILNALVYPVLKTLAFPITFLSFGLFLIVLNAIIFGLAAYLVDGFRLRWGIWSAILGALALSFITSILSPLLGLKIATGW